MINDNNIVCSICDTNNYSKNLKCKTCSNFFVHRGSSGAFGARPRRIIGASCANGSVLGDLAATWP